jgi:hypothetical protein
LVLGCLERQPDELLAETIFSHRDL